MFEDFPSREQARTKLLRNPNQSLFEPVTCLTTPIPTVPSVLKVARCPRHNIQTTATMKRTYGRKNSRRARAEAQDLQNDFPPPRKRPRIEVEIVPPTSPYTSIPTSHLSPPRATSPIRRSITLPDVCSTSSTPSTIRTPTKPARDLSTLFPTSLRRTPSSPEMSLGVVKRMLSRSRTESSLDLNISHNSSSFTRAF